MVIIRDLNENGNLIEPSTRDGHIILWNYYYRNTERIDGTIDCKLVELGMVDSCKSSISFNSDRSGCSDNDSFFPSVS